MNLARSGGPSFATARRTAGRGIVDACLVEEREERGPVPLAGVLQERADRVVHHRLGSVASTAATANPVARSSADPVLV